MWLNNTDKEVECFHPVCQMALEMALRGLNLCEKYEVQHHRHVGSIEMDFVIANKASNRILCVIEVKRTIASVNSTRYQYQAMSYVQALSEQQLESKYYLLTNLEASCLFKFDRDRPNVYEQIVEPGICINHRFAEVSKDVFISDLSKQYTRFLTTIIQDQGHYLLSFARFAAEFQNECAFGLAWKTKLVGLFYEYIRGAFTTLKRKELKTIPQLSRRADLICKEGLKVNFVDIFNLKNLSPQEKITTDRNLLQQLFDLGKTYIDADELANVMHKVVANEHEGEVSTDIELANLMLQIVKHYIGTLSSEDKIMDPAAGSGSLLCASTNVFDGLQPCQLVANDINERFLQLLSLRLGLKFAHTIKPDHSAHISSLDIADMPARQFDDVRVIVMNPPYLSAVSPQCATRKAKLFDRIRHHKGGEPMTNIGQMPLEGPFVELVSTLAKEGTVIAAILPNTHFTTKGESSQAIRKMLLDTFGLQLIFNYPQEGLFKEVAQNTSIVLGIKGSQSSEVRYLYCNVAISEVDAKSIEQVMATNLSGDRIVDINGQFEGILISRHELQATVKNGWKLGNMSKHEALQFITDAIGHSSCLTPLKNSEFRDYSRGKIGNEGCTDLLFLKANDTFLTIAEKQLQGHLKVGLNRAKYDLVDIGSGDSFFLDVSDMTDRQIMTIIKKFLEVKSSKKEKKQRRDKKSPDEYLEILKRESTNVTHAYSVMLPRSIRSSGRVFYTTQQAFVSTNFFVIQADEKKSRILSSWFSTIFYQLECEVFGNNRKGLRKMEKEDFEPLHVPIIAQLTDEQTRKIISTPITEFVNLRVPQPRAIDHVWAEILFGERAQEYIEKVLLFLPILAEDREK